MLREAPLVYAVDRDYQIVCRVNAACLCTVRVGDKEYADHNNGVMRSSSEAHRVCVPMTALDAAGGYTLCLRAVSQRKPYFSQCDDPITYEFPFYPVPSNGVRAFHISDAHERVEAAVAAARCYRAFDLLIVNGDLANHNDTASQVDVLFSIASALTRGEIPVVFSRGNHDTRGAFAERFTDYIPLHNGHTYYTFRLGGVWGLVLDCGEDKVDSHAEYGHTASFHAFREQETAFLEEVAAKREFEQDGIHTRLVIVHNPFTHQLNEPFNIEEDLYRQWATILKERIHPDMMLCGHLHKIAVHHADSAFDHLGQPCPLVVGGEPFDGGYSGVGLEFSKKGITMQVADSEGFVLEKTTVVRKGDVE